MASLKQRITKIIGREFVTGKVYRVDMDRVDVLPDGSAGVIHSLPLTGDREKVKPGDEVSILNVAGERVAVAGDLALADISEEIVEDASAIETEELMQSFVGSGGGGQAPLTATDGPVTGTDRLMVGGLHLTGDLTVDGVINGMIDNANTLQGYAPATSGANAHIPLTDTGGGLTLDGYVGINNSLAVRGDYLAVQGRVLLTEIAAPATPSAGSGALFMSTDNFPYVVNDGGYIIPLSNQEIGVPLAAWHPISATWHDDTYNLHLAFADGATQVAATSVNLPYHWRNKLVYLDLWFVSTYTAASDLVFWAHARYHSHGQVIPTSSASLSGNVIAAAYGAHMKMATINLGVYNPPNSSTSLQLRLSRYGNVAEDTNTGTAYIFGARLRI